MKRHAIFAIAALAALLVLSACSAEAEPKVQPTPTLKPSATATPSEEPLRTDTPENTIRSWFAELDDAQISGDTSQLDKLAYKSCEFCTQVTAVIEGVREGGGRILTGAERILSIRELPTQGLDDHARSFEVISETPPTTFYYGADDTRNKKAGLTQTQYSLFLRKEGGTWLIAGLNA